MLFIYFIITSSLLCLSSAVSLTGLGMKPHPHWHKGNEILGKNWLKCNTDSEINTANKVEMFYRVNNHVRAHFSVVTAIFGIPLV